MGRIRCVITARDKRHFVFGTVVEWLPVFIRPESVDILLKKRWRRHRGLWLFG